MEYVTIAPLVGYYFSFTLETNSGYDTEEINDLRIKFTEKLIPLNAMPDLESSYLIRTIEKIDTVRHYIISLVEETAHSLKINKNAYSFLITLIAIAECDNIKSSKFNNKQFNDWKKCQPLPIQ